MSMSVRVASIVILCGAGVASAEFDPGETVAEAVRLIERQHLTSPQIDENLSVRWSVAFLRELDPRGLYFFASDLSEWSESSRRFGKEARRGEISFPERVRERVRQRVDWATRVGDVFLTAEHDFTVDEECPQRFDDWADDEEALRERWRLEIKRELLIEKLHRVPIAQTRARVTSRHERLRRRASKMTDEQLVACCLDGLLHEVDPHATYLSEEHLALYDESVTMLKFSVGLKLDRRHGRWIVTGIHPSFGRNGTPEMLGCEVIAIRRPDDGTTFDLVELSEMELEWMLRSPFEGLEGDSEVVLELFHPQRLERTTLSWPRLSYR